METVNMRFEINKTVHGKLKAQAALANKDLYAHIIEILTKAADKKNGERRSTH